MQKNLLAFSILLLSLAGCAKSGELVQGEGAKLNVDKTEIRATAEGETQMLGIKSNCYWDVTVADESGKLLTWVSATPSRGQGDCDIQIEIAGNVKTEERVAYITVSTPASASLTKKITLTQDAGEEPKIEGYDFPIIQTIDIDSPDSRQLVGAVIGGNVCQFTNGMTVTWSNPEGVIALECPSHTQPSTGDDAAKSIHRSLRFDGFAQGDDVVISVPTKNALSGDLRLMLGARAASFTSAGWSYYWSADAENWNQVEIKNAVTPGSDAVWNVIYFTIPEAQAIPAGGTLNFKIKADKERSKTYICISNTICICNAKAEMSSLPAMDENTVAYTNGFDDLVASKAANADYDLGLMCDATNSYASNYTSFNSQYTVPVEDQAIAAAKGCYERPGYLQLGYYDCSLWTRQAIGTYTIKIGERLKMMGVSSTDAEFTFDASIFKDFRGYDPLAKVTVTVGEDSYPVELNEGAWKNCKITLANLDQNSEIKISCPRLSDEEVEALGRGEYSKYLLDYRFYIDNLKVVLTDIHSRGASSEGGNEDFSTGADYNW